MRKKKKKVGKNRSGGWKEKKNEIKIRRRLEIEINGFKND